MSRESNTSNPQPETDPVMHALKHADPVDHSQVPSAHSDAAQSLLTEITSRPAGTGFSSYSSPAPKELPTSRPGRYRFLAAVAVAIAVVAAGISFVLPSNTEPALALVQAAAGETQRALSGRVTTTLSADGTDGTDAGQVDATIEVLFNDGDLAVTVSSISSEGQDFSDLQDMELRLVDDVAYIKADQQWTGLDAPTFINDLVLARYADPTVILDEVKSLTEVTAVGTETIDGVAATHYRSEINLAEGEPFNASGWLGQMASQLALETDGTVVIDLYVGEDGLLRLMKVTADIVPSDPSESGQASISVSTRFSDLNSDIEIVAPEGVEIIDLAELERLGEFNVEESDD